MNETRRRDRLCADPAFTCSLLQIERSCGLEDKPLQEPQRRPWIIFDADNTLWDVESLYDEFRTQACAFAAKLCDQQPLALEEWARHRDTELYATYGYSPLRFVQTAEDTLRHFHPQASSAEIERMRGLAGQVFKQAAPLVEDIEPVLRHFRPHYQMGIITSGDREIQEWRLGHFPHRELFDAIEIVEKKLPEVFTDFCQRKQVDTAQSWVIGDSWRSDIIPARAAGLRAVHFDAVNWHPIERAGFGLHDDVPVISRFSQLIEIIPTTDRIPEKRPSDSLTR